MRSTGFRSHFLIKMQKGWNEPQTLNYAVPPRIAYDRMLPPGVYSLSISYLFFIIQNPFNQSTAVSEKISFRVGKKAVADRQALLLFWVKRWLVRIAIVLGCVGWFYNSILIIKFSNLLFKYCRFLSKNIAIPKSLHFSIMSGRGLYLHTNIDRLAIPPYSLFTALILFISSCVTFPDLHSINIKFLPVFSTMSISFFTFWLTVFEYNSTLSLNS